MFSHCCTCFPSTWSSSRSTLLRTPQPLPLWHCPGSTLPLPAIDPPRSSSSLPLSCRNSPTIYYLPFFPSSNVTLEKLSPSSVNRCTHLFIVQQVHIFIVHLLCGRLWAWCWRSILGQGRNGLYFMRIRVNRKESNYSKAIDILHSG